MIERSLILVGTMVLLFGVGLTGYSHWQIGRIEKCRRALSVVDQRQIYHESEFPDCKGVP